MPLIDSMETQLNWQLDLNQGFCGYMVQVLDPSATVRLEAYEFNQFFPALSKKHFSLCMSFCFLINLANLSPDSLASNTALLFVYSPLINQIHTAFAALHDFP